MPGLRSDVNPLAGGAPVACSTAVEGASLPGAGGRAAADSVGGNEAGPESRAREVGDTPASENGWMSSVPVIRVRDCSRRAVLPTGRGARGSRPGSCCAHGFVGLLDAA